MLTFNSLSNNDERKEWIYDEATCSQFVFLYSELTQRYKNNCKEYFDFYGKVRPGFG
ncbi:MAG: virulence factor SrfB [Bacteroidales bacterium]|nr:virulence factor SrfB [Bacteroidales bacterium]